MEHWQNIVRVSNSKLEGSLLNVCKEAAVDYVADRDGMPMLDFAGKSVARNGDPDCWDLEDSSPHQEQCERMKPVQRRLKNLELL